MAWNGLTAKKTLGFVTFPVPKWVPVAHRWQIAAAGGIAGEQIGSHPALVRPGWRSGWACRVGQRRADQRIPNVVGIVFPGRVGTSRSRFRRQNTRSIVRLDEAFRFE